MKDVVLRMREIILGADARMQECIKWQAPTFTFEGNLASFFPIHTRSSSSFQGERLVMRTAEGPFPMETMYTWETVGEAHTRMTLRNRGAPSGFSKLAAPFMAAAMRPANRKDLARLKAVLEHG